jgi:Protein of unknown function (DUF1236)
MSTNTTSSTRPISIGLIAISALVCGAVSASAQQVPQNNPPPAAAEGKQSPPAAQQKAAPAGRDAQSSPSPRASENQQRRVGNEGGDRRDRSDRSNRSKSDEKPAASRRNADDDVRRKQQTSEPRRATQPSAKQAEDRGDAKQKSTNRESGKRAQQQTEPKASNTKQAQPKASTPSPQQDAGAASKRGDQQSRTAPDAIRNGQARLNDDQRARFRQSLFTQQNSRRIARANFTVGIGQRIPRSARLLVIPAALIAIAPAYRSYRYVVVDDQICIVEPSTYEIVEVIDRGSDVGKSEQIATLELNQGQRDLVLRRLLRSDAPRADINIGLALGAEIPPVVSLLEFPQELVADIQQLGRYRYVLVENNVVIVNPSNRVVLLVVRG